MEYEAKTFAHEILGMYVFSVSRGSRGGWGGGSGGWCWEGRVREARTTSKVLEAKRREGWSGYLRQIAT